MTLHRERYDVLTTRPPAESATRGSNPLAEDPYARRHGSDTDQHEAADAWEHGRQIPAAGKEDSVIEAQHLTKRYGDKVAVDDLSFTVRPGIVTGFLGPNGSGNPVTELRHSLSLGASSE